jgi:hypothetical protein
VGGGAGQGVGRQRFGGARTPTPGDPQPERCAVAREGPGGLRSGAGVDTALYPCEDADTQERALWGAVLEGVQGGELWIADRNCCTAGFLTGLAERGAYALIRAHEGLRFTPLEPMRDGGRTATGTVAEQWVHLGPRHKDSPIPNNRMSPLPAC